jgi:hypothetical protein
MGIKGRIKVGLVLIGTRSVFGIAYMCGEGFNKKKENLIPQVFVSSCGLREEN